MSTSSFLVGAVVPLSFTVTDEAGDLAAPGAVTLTITLPNGTTSTPTPENPSTGVYTYDFTPASAGRHVARFVATGANAGADEDVFDANPASAAVVTVADAREYLGQVSVDDTQLAAVIVAEQQAQARRCRIEPYSADLREALLRRVAFNLSARNVPLASYTSFAEGGTATTRVPTQDPEVRRLEAPYVKVVLG